MSSRLAMSPRTTSGWFPISSQTTTSVTASPPDGRAEPYRCLSACIFSRILRTIHVAAFSLRCGSSLPISSPACASYEEK